MAVDFIPDPCIGTNIFKCLDAKQCDLEALVDDLTNPLPDVEASFDASLSKIGQITIELNAANLCIVTGITAAFALAGEPLPTIPPNYPTPNFTGITDDLSDMSSEIVNELGYLSAVFTLEDDGSKITRIQSA